MKLIDLLTKDERQQLRVRYDDGSFPDYVNELLDKEVYPVNYGRWVDWGFYADYHGQHDYQCSVCGGHIVENEPDPFCRWCGARMD